MEYKKEYRSAIRSKKLIRNAFTELLQEKSFERITVTDVVKRADINRSTFYAHYPDIMGIIEEIQNELIERMQNVFDPLDFSQLFKNPKPILDQVVKSIEENYELYRVLSKSAITQKYVDALKHSLVEMAMNNMEITDVEIDKVQLEFRVRFFIGGVIDVYTQWFNGEMNCSMEEMVDNLAELIICSCEGYL